MVDHLMMGVGVDKAYVRPGNPASRRLPDETP
jgi:hypothetical protein